MGLAGKKELTMSGGQAGLIRLISLLHRRQTLSDRQLFNLLEGLGTEIVTAGDSVATHLLAGKETLPCVLLTIADIRLCYVGCMRDVVYDIVSCESVPVSKLNRVPLEIVAYSISGIVARCIEAKQGKS